jgi:hypothetical protein
VAHKVFVGASAAATLPAALAAAVLVSAPFSGTAVAPLADAHDVAATSSVAEQAPVTPSGPGTSDWALIAMGEAVVIAGAAATIAMRRRALRCEAR